MNTKSLQNQINELKSVGINSHKKVMNLIEEQKETIRQYEREIADFSDRIEKLENAINYHCKKAS